MKKLLIIVLFIFLINDAQAQTQANDALYVRAGYSWFTGVIGLEYQIGHIGFGIGWMPTETPITIKRVNAYGLSATLYSGLPNENSYYLSGVYIINGYQIENINDVCDSEIGYPVLNMLGIMAGHKWAFETFDIKTGVGLGFYEVVTFTAEITIGINLLGF